MVIWLIGMSASGKTTIGKHLFAELQKSSEKWVFIDGDTFRSILGNDLGHSLEDRRLNAYRISRFCEFLSSQNINVLASVLSIFHDNQQYNRENIPNYKEVYIDVNFEILKKRDNKNLYKQAMDGKVKNVVGVDIEFKPPVSPDLVINNDTRISDFSDITTGIIKEFNINIDEKYKYTTRNLLKTPQKYQYSSFEGTEFFVKYFRDRNNTLEFIEKRLVKLKRIRFSENEIIDENYLLDNNLVLKRYLQFLLASKNDVLNEHRDFVDILIKRFEVSKKLYETYDAKTVKKSSSNFDELTNYSNFSLLLQKYYKIGKTKEAKVIYFNSILKLNDILSSVKENLILPRELELTKKAILGELKITESYL